jgi:hypothetical protein
MFKAGFVVPLTLTVCVIFTYWAAVMYRGYKNCKAYLAKRKGNRKHEEQPAVELHDAAEALSNSDIDIEGLEEEESASPSSNKKKEKINKN